MTVQYFPTIQAMQEAAVRDFKALLASGMRPKWKKHDVFARGVAYDMPGESPWGFRLYRLAPDSKDMPQLVEQAELLILADRAFSRSQVELEDAEDEFLADAVQKIVSDAITPIPVAQYREKDIHDPKYWRWLAAQKSVVQGGQ